MIISFIFVQYFIPRYEHYAVENFIQLFIALFLSFSLSHLVRCKHTYMHIFLRLPSSANYKYNLPSIEGN